MAEVAKTLPCVPAANTETDAISTMMSAERQKRRQPLPRLLHSHIHAHRLTDHTERFSGKFQSSSPSSVATAAASSPNPHHVLHPEHHDGHHFLEDRQTCSTEGPSVCVDAVSRACHFI